MGWAWGLKKFSSLPPEIEFQGISPEFFFTGVCYGGLITLSLQLALGLFLRERPLFALATAATAAGIWTVIPYAVATCTALFIYLRHGDST